MNEAQELMTRFINAQNTINAAHGESIRILSARIEDLSARLEETRNHTIASFFDGLAAAAPAPVEDAK